MVKRDADSPPAPLSGKVHFDYIKSNFFRVIYVDGVHGGVRPNGTTIHMALFSERNAIPQSEEHEVNKGKLGKRTNTSGREAIIREVEIDAIFPLETAKAIREWLDQKITIIESLMQNESKE